MRVIISDAADADLEAIGDYIARENPKRAVSFIDELLQHCTEIGEMPKAYPLTPRYEKFGIRRRVSGNYLIFYRIQDEEIVIAHILHGATDYASILFDA